MRLALLFPCFLLLSVCSWPPPTASAQEKPSRPGEDAQKTSASENVIANPEPRREGLLARRPLEEARTKDEQTPSAQPANKLRSMRKGLVLAAMVTLLLVGLPLSARFIDFVKRAKNRQELNTPREQLPALEQRIAKGARYPFATQPQISKKPAAPAGKITPLIRSDLSSKEETPTTPPPHIPQVISSPQSNDREHQILRTAALLPSSPLPIRMRLITSLEVLIDKLYREKIEKRQGTPW